MPDQLVLADLQPNDLEVWGLNGSARGPVVCSTSLPVVRHKPTELCCVLDVRRAGGPSWSPQAEVEGFLHLGRVSRLIPPLPLPDHLFPLSPAVQPLMAWAGREFWGEDGPARDPGATDEEFNLKYGGRLRWAGRAVDHAGRPDRDGRPEAPAPVDTDFLWVACGDTADVEHDLERQAGRHLDRYDGVLLDERPDWPAAEQVAYSGLCAARRPATRYAMYVRYGAAMYYRDRTDDGSDLPTAPERCRQVVQLFVRNEFPGVTWERFRDDMAAVVLRSRDVLRFQAANRHPTPTA